MESLRRGQYLAIGRKAAVGTTVIFNNPRGDNERIPVVLQLPWQPKGLDAIAHYDSALKGDLGFRHIGIHIIHDFPVDDLHLGVLCAPPKEC